MLSTSAQEELVDKGFETAAQTALRTGAVSYHQLANQYPDEPTQVALVTALRSRGLKSATAVPLRVQGRIVGALTCYSATSSPLSSSDLSLLTTIADQVAVAVENARLYMRSRDVATLEERQRLARELHDSVSQALYGIALGARTARTLLDRDAARAAEPLEYVLAQAEAGLAEMRALIFELRPDALEKEGLVAALTKQAESLRVRHGIAVKAHLSNEPDVPFETKEALYRIAQEAMHNTVKHARARAVDLSLTWDAEDVVLEVRDDGTGFDPARGFPGHLGLQTMKERAMRLGGTLQVESAPGSGTRIAVQVPCCAGDEPAVHPPLPSDPGPPPGATGENPPTLPRMINSPLPRKERGWG
jgi:signal transduction histidine kinase